MDTSLRVNKIKINKLYKSYLNYKNKLLCACTHLRITVLPQVCFTFNFHITVHLLRMFSIICYALLYCFSIKLWMYVLIYNLV